jgi:hypothetical protein
MMAIAKPRQLGILVIILLVGCLLSCGQYEAADDGPRPVEPIPAPSGNAPLATEIDFPSTPNRPDPNDIYGLTPTIDKDDPAKVYIPRDLDDCFAELSRMLHPKFVEKLKARESEATNQHFGLGLWMRNNWGLWGDSHLNRYFHDKGIFHPDDMSGIILKTYIRHLNSQPIELEAQIKFYQDYWAKQSKRKRVGITVLGDKNVEK